MSRSLLPILLLVASPLLAVPGARSPVLARTVNPQRWNSVCPHEFRFIGEITSRGAGNVTYRWDRSDRSSGPVEVIHFSGPNERQTVATSWTLAQPRNVVFHGWEQIRVMAPNFIRSNKAAFTLHCR